MLQSENTVIPNLILTNKPVPKGRAKIARRFNAGSALFNVAVPKGCAENGRSFQPSLRDFCFGRIEPGVETPGYFRTIPPGFDFAQARVMLMLLAALFYNR